MSTSRFKSVKTDKTYELDEMSKKIKTAKINGNRYQILEPLGRGAFGEVYKALKIGDYQYLAIKFIKTTDPEIVNLVKTEIATLQYLTNQLKGQSPFPRIIDSQIFFNEGIYGIVIIMEYLEGPNLEEFLEENNIGYGYSDRGSSVGVIDNGMIKTIFRQIALAVNLLHSMEIVHRDLKPSNIMILKDRERLGLKDILREKKIDTTIYRIIILDFGLACNRSPRYLFEHLESIELIQASQLCTKRLSVGTLTTMDPVVLNPTAKRLTFEALKKTDLWSLGIILYRMIYSKYPPSSLKPIDQYQTIQRSIDKQPTIYNSILTELFKPLERRLGLETIIDNHLSLLGLPENTSVASDEFETSSSSLLLPLSSSSLLSPLSSKTTLPSLTRRAPPP